LKDKIDLSVGLNLRVKLGDRVQAGDALVTAYYNDEGPREEMIARLRAAYLIEDAAPSLEPLVKAVI
jgi:pyrimidine-nucleoside phosphorylase